jgi:hypothetical protein
MRDISPNFAAGIKACIRMVGIAVMALISACATPPLVVKTDPSFALTQIRSVYVVPFASPDGHRDAGHIMTQALREQLQADGILHVVDEPGLADAYVQGAVEKWVQGGLDLSGTRPTKISGSLALLDPARRSLWSVVAEQWDPLRILADGLFARDPSALAPHWVRTVLEQLPGYTLKRRPGMVDLSERFLAGESMADLSWLYRGPPQGVERSVRQELAAKRNGHERSLLLRAPADVFYKTAADEAHIRDGVMRGTTRAGREQGRVAAGEAGDTVHAAGLEGLGQGDGQQNSGEPAR